VCVCVCVSELFLAGHIMLVTFLKKKSIHVFHIFGNSIIVSTLLVPILGLLLS
jgi:hypothetical protein